MRVSGQAHQVFMKSSRTYLLLLMVFFVVACSNPTSLQSTSGDTSALQPMVFKKGNYRQDGKCTKLIQDKNDITPFCNTFIGVIALEDNKPRFTFSLQNGDFWAFTASGPATYSNGNRVAIYPVSHIYQKSSTLSILYAGECKLSMDPPYENIDCMTWADKNRTQEAWKASFVGNGSWRYKPN
jgi:hypothetical protein